MSSVQPTTPASESTRSSSLASSSVRDGVAAANANFVAAFASGDSTAVAACYTADAQLLPANSDVVTGRDAIDRFWRGIIEKGIAEVRLETAEVESSGDLATEVGRYALAGADGGTIDLGKYVVVWHRDGGTWKIHRDIWTTSQPAPQA